MRNRQLSNFLSIILDRVEYKKGTTYQARVLSFKMVERILIVATRKDILAQKMVGVKVRLLFQFLIFHWFIMLLKSVFK